MKKSTKTMLAIGAAGAAAYFLFNKNLSGADAQEAGGSLGGDDSLTNDDNPFARIDPNYQYPSEPVNNYFLVNPDGSVVPTDGTFGPTDGYTSSDGSSDGGTGSSDSVGSTSLMDVFKQGIIWGGGYLAVTEGFKALKAPKNLKQIAETDVINNKKINTKSKTPEGKIRDSLGFKANERLPAQDIMQAKFTTDTDFSLSKSTRGKGGKLKTTEPVLKTKILGTEPVKTPSKAGKVAKGAGKVLIVGHVIDRTFGAWNEYGSTLIEPRINKDGETKGATIGSTAKAVGFTGLQASSDILGDLFGFATGLIYRPKTSAESQEDTTTGWFATEKDLFNMGKGMIQTPKETFSAITGIGELNKAFTGSSTISTKPKNKSGSSSSSSTIVASPVSASPSYSSPTNVNIKSSATSVYGQASYNAATNTYTNSFGQKQSMATAPKSSSSSSSSSATKSVKTSTSGATTKVVSSSVWSQGGMTYAKTSAGKTVRVFN